jgi:hypothetical protein
MRTFLSALTIVFLAAGAASAQTVEAARTVGRKGAMQLGISFSTSTSLSTSAFDGSQSSTTNLFGTVDVGRFLSEKFLVRFGISGFGTVGGPEQPAGDPFLQQFGIEIPEQPTVTFTMLGGGLFYFTPQKISSFYVGGDVAVPMSDVGTGDPLVNGRLGVQTAIRNNASLFVEGGYGTVVGAESSSGSLSTNIGLRVLF